MLDVVVLIGHFIFLLRDLGCGMGEELLLEEEGQVGIQKGRGYRCDEEEYYYLSVSGEVDFGIVGEGGRVN